MKVFDIELDYQSTKFKVPVIELQTVPNEWHVRIPKDGPLVVFSGNYIFKESLIPGKFLEWKIEVRINIEFVNSMVDSLQKQLVRD